MKRSFFLLICFIGFISFSCQNLAMNVNKKQAAKKKKSRKKKKRNKKLNLYQLNKKLLKAIIKNDTEGFGSALSLGARPEGVYNPVLIKKVSDDDYIHINFVVSDNKISPFNNCIGSYMQGGYGSALVEKVEDKRRFAVEKKSKKKIVDLDIFLAIVRFLKKEDHKNKKVFHTPIHIAAKAGNEWIVKPLLKKGVSTEADCWKNYIKLQYFKNNKFERENLDIKWFSYPLHKAVKSNNIKVVRYLCKKKINVDRKNDDGYTPLDIAKMVECKKEADSSKNEEIKNILRSKMVKKDKKNKLTETVYQF